MQQGQWGITWNLMHDGTVMFLLLITSLLIWQFARCWCPSFVVCVVVTHDVRCSLITSKSLISSNYYAVVMLRAEIIVKNYVEVDDVLLVLLPFSNCDLYGNRSWPPKKYILFKGLKWQVGTNSYSFWMKILLISSYLVSILNHTQLRCNCNQRTVIRQDTWQKNTCHWGVRKVLHEAEVSKLGKCLFISELPF